MGPIEPLDYHHLHQVADLLERTFRDRMDSDGRAFLQRLRQVGRSWPTLGRREPGWIPELGLWGWVWVEGGRVVGHAGLYPARREDEAILVNVAVEETWRGRGIATALVQRVLEHGLRQGLRRLWLEVDVGNRPAQALYRRLGFSFVTTRWRWTLRLPRPVPSLPPMQAPVRPLNRGVWKPLAPHLRRLYPAELDWRFPLEDLSLLTPGWWSWVRRTFQGMRVMAWYTGTPAWPRAALFWCHMPRGRRQWLFLAAGTEATLEDLAPLFRPLFRGKKASFVLDLPQKVFELALSSLDWQRERMLEVWRFDYVVRPG